MEDTSLTSRYIEEIFNAVYDICKERPYIGFIDKTLLELLNVYKKMKNYNILQPQEIYIVDNDNTLGKPNDEPGKIAPGSIKTLPFTHKKMKWLISKFYDPSVLIFIASGRKTYDREYDATDPNIMAKIIAKNHGISEFVDRVWCNHLNGYRQPNWTEIINREIHKAIMIFIMKIMFPNINIYQYDDQQKALDLGIFAFNYATRILKNQNISSLNGILISVLVNLDGENLITAIN
jgi:hypothetical protein